ncbi:hypothetical protein [Paractinoplanes durhamensis]|uniref:hypothetical protein n=1 Tax=Paractinoplanes durhamensis TaxID=113563 RepID=UPI001EF30985|nr:hypothetical protein [Actinoplanes durhamensis]
MADSQQTPSPSLAEVSRAVVSVAATLVTNVQRAMAGPANVPTARDNAYFAMLADRARNQARDDLTREVAAMLATSPRQNMAKTR